MCLSFFQIQDSRQSRSKSAFSQKDIYLCIFILVFWCSPIMLASFKSKKLDVHIWPSHLFAFSNGVTHSKYPDRYLDSWISQLVWIPSIRISNYSDITSLLSPHHRSKLPRVPQDLHHCQVHPCQKPQSAT